MKPIFPPRPRGKINPNDLQEYERSGKWIVQRKFNGSRNLIYVFNDDVQVFSRYGREHKNYKLDLELKNHILKYLKFNKDVAYWLDSELMNKQVNATNEIVLYDVLQEGRYFFSNPNQMERLEILKRIAGFPTKRNDIALEISSRIWLAESYEKDFAARFIEAQNQPKIEGLVLRKKTGCLDNFGVTEYETGNLIRCRHVHKNYNF